MTYEYRPEVEAVSFSEAMEELKKAGHKVCPWAIDSVSPHIVDQIITAGSQHGCHFKPTHIDTSDYFRWFSEAGYLQRYPDYYNDNRREKSLEHYLAFRLLNMNSSDVFVDLAAEHSPVAEIYSRLSGCTSYQQDIMYPPGVTGHQIGGDACDMPVADEFFTKALLACSIEHFEGDADTRLFQELARVMRSGGVVVIVPFYVFIEAGTQTDPCVSVPAKVPFDDGASIYCAENWGNRHGRFYSPESFVERIMRPVGNSFTFEFLTYVNADQVDPSVYLRFAVVATRI